MKKLVMMALFGGTALGCPPGTITPEEYLHGHNKYNGYTGFTGLSGGLANGIKYADIEYIKEALQEADYPEQRLTAEEAHNFIERAKQLRNSEITKLIEQAPIIGPTGISYEQYLQMKEKQSTTPEQDQKN